MNLQELVSGPMGNQLISNLSNQMGIKNENVAAAVSVALPFLLTQMNRNAQSGAGASSLDNALNQHAQRPVAGAVNNFNLADGLGILGHLFGNRQNQVAQNIGKQSGISSGQVMQIMAVLAPIVMSYLGREKQQQNVGASGLSGLLGGLLGGMSQSNQREMSAIEQMLDSNNDGNISDDIVNIGSRLLGGFFRK
ncbi:MAG: DUF937 domain-containing protein [Weeksellaceae bacterium]|nr:DUF937 domain-containing protein [Weeksellaceae bacterium]